MLIWIAFLSLAYWNRTWIVQEIALARHAVIYCGGDSVTWADMVGGRLQNEYRGTGPNSSVVDGLPNYPHLSATFRARVSHVWSIHRLRQDTATRPKENILDILQELFDFKCENRLDRIYAVLSLESTTQRGFSEIKVDYTLLFPELLVDVLAKRYVFQSEESWLDHLPEEHHSNYISWVIRALELTTGECNELRDLILTKLHQAQKDANSLIVDRWDIVHAGLVLGTYYL